MALLCGAAAGFLSYLNGKTFKVIEGNRQREAVEAVMNKVIKGRYTDISVSSNPDSIFILKTVNDKETGKEKIVKFIDAKNSEGKLVVQVVENTSFVGYAGPIKILVGIDTAGIIIGSTVLSHTETPGLGDQMQREDFRSKFLGLSAEDGDIKITKFGGKIESISGASISSHAFTSAVNEALLLAKERIAATTPAIPADIDTVTQAKEPVQ
jgi:electron transport complex protein RnfG